jgi:hypothetical protein
MKGLTDVYEARHAACDEIDRYAALLTVYGPACFLIQPEGHRKKGLIPFVYVKERIRNGNFKPQVGIKDAALRSGSDGF